MRYLYIGLALIILVCAACVVGDRLLDARLGEIETQIVRAMDASASNDDLSARAAMREAKRLWDDGADFFTSVLLHQRVDAAEQLISAAAQMLESGQLTEDALPSALEAVRSLRDGEKLKIGNIL